MSKRLEAQLRAEIAELKEAAKTGVTVYFRVDKPGSFVTRNHPRGYDINKTEDGWFEVLNNIGEPISVYLLDEIKGYEFH